MPEMDHGEVLIVGAGPVGLTLAIDLAWRGIDVTVVEKRAAAEPPEPKCNHVAARSMEIFRRLGLAEKVRNAGLPADYPHDVSYRTTFAGRELTRIPIPCRRDRYTSRDGPDCNWPTPEPPHRINQIFLEPILFEHAAGQVRIQLVNRTLVEDVSIEENSASVVLRDLETGAARRASCRYLVGCDGARSVVRKAIGAELVGDAIVQRVQSTYIRAPDLVRRQICERVGHRGHQSQAVRHGLCHRRVRTMAGPQLLEAGRDRLRKSGSRRLYSYHPRRRRRFRITHHLQGGLVWPSADRKPVSRPLGFPRG